MTDADTQGIRAFLTERWPDLDEQASTLVSQADETIRPRSLAPPGSHRDRVLAALLDGGQLSAPQRQLEVGHVLGMGGMGVVHLGTQASLDREVAIKAVRPDKRSPDATVKLLQEAWIAGTLQHPNIVPIYDIGVGGEGEPLIVQQRIEGTPWKELLANDEIVQERFSTRDTFEWHLRVLLQVCNAISYAHARGILHLDVKPSNVMIGSFGEVFLLDWGLAMALRDDRSGRLPLAAENKDVIGTPAFMAPEMLAQGNEPLTERTDVYLLGSTLYQICAGHPPHRGEGPIATMFAAATKEPAPLTSVPDEVAGICSLAMAADPSARYASAAGLRDALRSFLEHRGAIRLADEARVKLGELEVLWLRSDADEEVDDAVRALFGEVRFGLEQAQAAWPEEPGAQEGLQRLYEGMARWELSRARLTSAQAMLTQLDAPPADLVAQVEERIAAMRSLGARVEELQALADDQDLTVGMRTRLFITGILGVAFTAVPVWRAIEPPSEELSAPMVLGAPIIYGAIFTSLFVWARDSMTRSAINRRTASTVYILLVSQALFGGAARAVGLTVSQTLPLLLTLYASIALMYAVHVDRRMLWTGFGYLVAMAGALLWPDARYWFIAAANVNLTLNALVVWRPAPVTKPRVSADGSEAVQDTES